MEFKRAKTERERRKWASASSTASPTLFKTLFYYIILVKSAAKEKWSRVSVLISVPDSD